MSVGRHFLLKLSSRVGICTSANFTQKKIKRFRFTSSSKWQSAMRCDATTATNCQALRWNILFIFFVWHKTPTWELIDFVFPQMQYNSHEHLFALLAQKWNKRKFESNRLGHGVEYWVPALELGHCTLHARTSRSTMCDRETEAKLKWESEEDRNTARS